MNKEEYHISWYFLFPELNVEISFPMFSKNRQIKQYIDWVFFEHWELCLESDEILKLEKQDNL